MSENRLFILKVIEASVFGPETTRTYSLDRDLLENKAHQIMDSEKRVGVWVNNLLEEDSEDVVKLDTQFEISNGYDCIRIFIIEEPLLVLVEEEV